MLKRLKYILNSFSDEELKNVDLWVDSYTGIDEIILEKRLCNDYSINLITENAEVKINEFIDKERKEEYGSED